LEEFNWESFEVWLDSISANLIACQDRESCGGAPLGDEEIESSESSSFPLPYPRAIHARDLAKPPPKEKTRGYPTDCQGCVVKYFRRRKRKMQHLRYQTLFVLGVEDFFLKKMEPLVTLMTGPVPLPRVGFSGSVALKARPRLRFPLCL